MASSRSATTNPSDSTAPEAPAAVEFEGITKYFSSSDVLANQNVSFKVAPNSVHAVIGENGAGKSTLMNILYGIHRPDSGRILLAGTGFHARSPKEAIAAGIGMVHQHFKLVPSFSVAENIVLGTEPARRLSPKAEVHAVGDFCERMGLALDPRANVENLAVGVQQRVEIAKLLWREANVLILDEPTAVLTPDEADDLFRIIGELSSSGRSVLFITHKLREVQEITDRVTVMRSGEVIATRDTAQLSQNDLAELMVGRAVDLASDYAAPTRSDNRLAGEMNRRQAQPRPAAAVKALRVNDQRGIEVVKSVSLQINAGEIVGLAGVSGNGQSDLVNAIAGLAPIEAGTVFLADTDVTTSSVLEHRDLGLSHIAEDRLEFGVSVDDNVRDNLLPGMQSTAYSNMGLLRPKESVANAVELIDRYQIAGAHPLGPVRTLSGGNMQKIVIARELEQQPSFLIASQPTRGVDVGSIEYIHNLLRSAAASGIGILLVSVELDEILALSDRVAVMFDGHLVADDVEPNSDARQRIGALMGGIK